MSGQRFLRPGAAFGIGDRVWVVDEFQPVAALIDPVEDLVGWRDLGPPPAGESVAMISDGHRLWVQPLPDRIELACFVSPESSEPDRDGTGAWRYSYELLNMTEHGVDTGALPWSARTPRYPGRSTSTTRGTDPVPGRVRDVVESRPLDITARCWPLVELTEDEVREHAEIARDGLGDLERCWYPQDGGPPSPLADGMSEVSMSFEGRWPELVVAVRFRHPYFPGGWMLRRIPLFDELGRPVVPENADLYLMEALEPRELPPW